MLAIGSYQTVVKQTGALPVLWAAGGIPLQLRTATTRQPEGLYLGSQPKQRLGAACGSCFVWAGLTASYRVFCP